MKLSKSVCSNFIAAMIISMISTAHAANWPSSWPVGESLVCYKNVSPTIPPPTGPAWTVYITDISGNGHFKLEARRNGVELYGDASRNVTLHYRGKLRDGRRLYQSVGGTVWMIFSERMRGEFHSRFYGKDVIGMICDPNGLIPESAMVPAEQ